MCNISPILKCPTTVLNRENDLNFNEDVGKFYDINFSKNGNGNNSFTFGMHEKENNCTHSDLCLTEVHCTDKGKKLNYSIKERFSEKERIEPNMEDIDFSEFKNLRTLPPKYSDEKDVRNNFICANNNIYIYAENKNGALLNEKARIAISNNNVVSYATKGRRYTIGGYANIMKRVNNEYHFSEKPNSLDVTDLINTLEFDSVENKDVLSSFNKMNLAKTNEFSYGDDIDGLGSSNVFDELMKSSNPLHSENSLGDRTLSQNMSVQKLFQDRKRYAQNVEHEQRICKPCAHVYNGSTCMNGDDCAFCHHSDHELISAKKWKKLVKNNVMKLNLLLDVLREPNETNINLLNEVMKPNVKGGLKKNKKLMNNGNTNMNMNMNMNMANNTHMHMYNNNFNNSYKHHKYNNYMKQNSIDRMPRNNNNGYNHYYQGSDTLDNNRTRHFIGHHHRIRMPRNYNNVMPTPHIHI